MEILLNEEEASRKVAKPKDVASIIQAWITTLSEVDKQKEHFFGVYLNSRNQITKIEVVSIGTVNSAIVHPREFFVPGILAHASACMMVHNHPSEVLEPSESDLVTAKRIREAGEVVGIELLDSLIVSQTDHWSARLAGQF